MSGATEVSSRRVTTLRGADCKVVTTGPDDGQPVVFFHSAAGLLGAHRFIETLGAAGFRVFAPELPGYGDSTGENLLEDMLDFTLHGWDVVDALGLERPALIGHAMGGMIAAEMTALCPERVEALVLAAPLGLWDDEHPIPDIFSLLPFQFAGLLFGDAKAGAALLTGGVNFEDMEALTTFFVGNARRLGTAGKILFPIPNRRLSKRLYRIVAPALLVWGSDDAYVPPVYADRWVEHLPAAQLAIIDGAAHMALYEDPERVAAEVVGFLSGLRTPV